MDSGAFRSLNLLPGQRDHNSNKTHSVYGLINRCCTPQGQRLLTQWLKQPLVDIHKIEERQNIVEKIKNKKRFPDFGRIEWKFIKEKAKLQDCYFYHSMSSKSL
jgi:DNA mismatch repair protein MSH2